MKGRESGGVGDKNRIPFNVLPLPSRLPAVSQSFLTNTEYALMATSGRLQGQVIPSASYYEYLWLPSWSMRFFFTSPPFSPVVSVRPPALPPVSPCRIRRRSPPLSDLAGGELKHIRPALDFDSIANGGGEVGERIHRALSALEGTGQPFKSSLNPEAFSEYHGLPIRYISWRQTAEWRALLREKHDASLVESPLLRAIEQSESTRRDYTQGNETDYFSSRTMGFARETRISVIHIYEDAIARGIKINGRAGLIRACTRDARLRVWVNDVVNNNINATSR